MKFKIIVCVIVTFVYVCVLGFKSSELLGTEKTNEVCTTSLYTYAKSNEEVLETCESDNSETVEEEIKEVRIVNTSQKDDDNKIEHISFDNKDQNDYRFDEYEAEIDEKNYSVKQILNELNIYGEYCVYDLFSASNKHVYMRMDDYWLIPDELGKLKVKLYVDYFDRSDEYEFEFEIKDLQAPSIYQNEAILPINTSYNILDYVDIIDNVDSLNDIRYEVIGDIDITTPGLYNIDLVVYDQSQNKNVETLYFEVLSSDDELYDLALSFIK